MEKRKRERHFFNIFLLNVIDDFIATQSFITVFLLTTFRPVDIVVTMIADCQMQLIVAVAAVVVVELAHVSASDKEDNSSFS